MSGPTASTARQRYKAATDVLSERDPVLRRLSPRVVLSRWTRRTETHFRLWSARICTSSWPARRHAPSHVASSPRSAVGNP